MYRSHVNFTRQSTQWQLVNLFTHHFSSVVSVNRGQVLRNLIVIAIQCASCVNVTQHNEQYK